MKRLIKRGFAEPFNFAQNFLHKGSKKLTILIYHSVNPPHPNSVTSENFSKQLQYLLSHFEVIGIYELIDLLNRGEIPSRNSVVLTFDDGYEDNYQYAYPLLKEYDCTATIFVCTGFVNRLVDITQKTIYKHLSYDGLQPLSWEQIKEMADGGITFGVHTHFHKILTGLPLKKAEEEILTSRDILQEVLSRPINVLAYPWGFFNNDLIKILKNNDFVAACSTICSTRNRKRDLFALRRAGIDATDSMREFILKVNGGYDFISLMHRLKRWKLRCL